MGRGEKTRASTTSEFLNHQVATTTRKNQDQGRVDVQFESSAVGRRWGGGGGGLVGRYFNWIEITFQGQKRQNGIVCNIQLPTAEEGRAYLVKIRLFHHHSCTILEERIAKTNGQKGGGRGHKNLRTHPTPPLPKREPKKRNVYCKKS